MNLIHRFTRTPGLQRSIGVDVFVAGHGCLVHPNNDESMLMQFGA